MEFLPIDYYILLQEGYDQPREPLRSNHVFYTNLPLLVKKRSYIKQSTDIIKNITFEDIMRCLDKKEAENLLTDNFAQDELIAHIKKEYGEISNLFHINYVPSQILNTFMRVGKDVSTDEIHEFEESLSKVANE